MAFQQDSIYLNLQKDLHSIKYDNVEGEQKPIPIEEKLYGQNTKKIEEKDLASNTMLFFTEKEMVLRDIKNICLYFQNDVLGFKQKSIPFVPIITRINVIIHKYIEKPSLLDNCVEPILNDIVNALRVQFNLYLEQFQRSQDISSINKNLDSLVSVIMVLVSVRGVKNVQKYLGHDTSDFEPLLFFLISSENRVNWQTKHFLFIWLSVVLFIPFEFNRMDSSVISQYYSKIYQTEKFDKIETLILDFCKRSLFSNSRIGQSIASCAAVIFRRPDMNNLDQFRDLLFWGIDSLIQTIESNEAQFHAINIYRVINQMIKNCKRDFLIKIHRELFEKIVWLDIRMKQMTEEPANLKCQKLKLLACLMDKILVQSSKRRIYKTIKKNIHEQLDESLIVPMITNTENITSNYKDDEETNQGILNAEIHNLEYIHMVEKIIDFLLESMQDKNSEVRYQASKTMAIIGYKLPENLSDELLATVLSFYKRADECLTHSICLVIGEYCRKRILTPQFLPQVFKVLNASLMYEDTEGLSSSGSIVRDAACYISWSLAKFYEKETLQSFVKELAVNLLITSLFDKENMCRRAAAASFQENVGRQGHFPHGIEIISEMDYFTVGIKQNSFLKIAPFVAQYPEYRQKFIDHLAYSKLYHFHKDTRMLSAKSLALIGLMDPEYIGNKIIKHLIQKSKTGTLFERHGSINALANILLTFSGNTEILLKEIDEESNIFMKSLKINDKKLVQPGQYMEDFQKSFQKLQNQNFLSFINEDLIKELCEIPCYIIKSGQLKGLGGEIQRIAIARFIFGVSEAQIALSQENIEIYFDFMEEAFRTTIDDIQDAVNLALKPFTYQYMKSQPNKYLKYIELFIHRIENEKIKDIKKSFCLGISSFPIELIDQKLSEVIQVLKKNCVQNKKIAMNDPDIRKFSIYSFGKILELILSQRIDKENFKLVFKTFLNTINDFTIDKRGDIGLIIREQTIDSVYDIMKIVINKYSQEDINLLYDDTIIINELGWILSLLMEPNNKIRLKAGYLMQMITTEILPHLKDFEGKNFLQEIFDSKNLRLRYQEFQEQHFAKYDVSLIDSSRFMDYLRNDKFVFFWDLPKCVYQPIVSVLKHKRFQMNILKGLMMSINNKTEDISNESYNALLTFLKTNESLQKDILQNLLKIFIKYQKKEKFYNATLSLINKLLEEDLIDFRDEETFREFIFHINSILLKKKSLGIYLISSKVICQLLGEIEIDKIQFLDKYKKIIELFIYTDYPIVRNEFLENFYLLLLNSGDEWLDAEKTEELCELISQVQATEQGEQFFYLFKSQWEEYFMNSQTM